MAKEITQKSDNIIEVMPTGLRPGNTALDQNPAAIYLASLRSSGRMTMQGSLNTVAQMLTQGQHDLFSMPWGQLRYQHTMALRSQLQERYSPATTNKILSAVRRVLQEAWRLGQMPSEEYHRAVDLKNVRGSRLPTGRAIKGQEVKELLRVCRDDPRPLGRRDLALLALLYASGLRRSEIVALDLADYDLAENSVRVRAGKGSKERIVYLANGVDKPLLEWLEVRGDDPGPLFCPVSWKGKLLARRLTDQSVAYLLSQRAKEAGVKAVSPHDFRRTFISNLLDAGADISTVQQLAGHADVNTTARYDRRGAEAKKRAAGLISLPEETG